MALVTAWFSFTMLEAGIASYRAERYLQYWETLKEAPSASARTKAKEAALEATESFPVANGEYLDRLGRVYAWDKGAAPGHDDMAAARLSFSESLEARPSWPWTWVRMVYAKLQLEEVDDEFSNALLRADQTGGGYQEVDRELAQMGLRAWPQLTVSERALVLKAAGRSIASSKVSARSIYAVAQRTGQTVPLCLSLAASIKTRQHICQEALQ
ncbi:hypothetical protein [Pseudomonas matsuisoli]|uniref:Uncharacterized protein n=1 Tax=Pseudomonas matsuisoli TaxID=1515666 RepID=A0A917V024_9PSED|nr:hypothetical protein [Pseudomonas matsuisoli]GGK05565.1 hypothetical protein GCM10009304_34630 [Pseudomonas matsuisoli]